MAGEAVMVHESYDDPVLGRVAWDASHLEWVFTLTSVSGRAIAGSIVPPDSPREFGPRERAELSERVRWVIENDLILRQRLADSMFDGWLEDCFDQEAHVVRSKAEFRDAVFLDGIWILDDELLELIFDDGMLFGGHAIVVALGPNGEFEGVPDLSG